MTDTLCGGVISSRRGLLASLWSLVTILTALSFLLALIFTLSAKNERYYNEYNGGDNEDEDYDDRELAVTSRAMAFSALWIAVLSTLMAIFGTVILGWQSPTGQYYMCCSPQVTRTTPLALGSFIGSLMMFSNMTLVCSVLFGEFEIRDYRDADNDRGHDQDNPLDTTASRSSTAFSVMCIFLTVLYASFAALTFSFSNSVLEELAMDERQEALASTRSKGTHFVSGYEGYIGDRFGIRNGGFVAPTPPDRTLT